MSAIWWLEIFLRRVGEGRREEVTNCSDRIPFYNLMWSRKAPPGAVWQLLSSGLSVLYL